MKKNLILRTISGLVFVAVMVFGLYTNVFVFTCLQCLVLMLSMMEFYHMIWGAEAHTIHKVVGVVNGLLLIAIMSGYVPFTAFMLSLAILFILQLYIKKDSAPFTTIAQTLLGIAYIALPISMWYLFVHKGPGDFYGRELLGCFIILWSCDVGAYVFGYLFGRHGRHKLFPRLSPKKTWEGLIGGFISALVTSWLVNSFIFPAYYAYFHFIVIAAIITAFGVWGDLVESQLKRSLNVKDSGNMIPGHGGLLDRFDASFLAIPAAYFYLNMVGVL